MIRSLHYATAVTPNCRFECFRDALLHSFLTQTGSLWTDPDEVENRLLFHLLGACYSRTHLRNQVLYFMVRNPPRWLDRNCWRNWETTTESIPFTRCQLSLNKTNNCLQNFVAYSLLDRDGQDGSGRWCAVKDYLNITPTPSPAYTRRVLRVRCNAPTYNLFNSISHTQSCLTGKFTQKLNSEIKHSFSLYKISMELFLILMCSLTTIVGLAKFCSWNLNENGFVQFKRILGNWTHLIHWILADGPDARSVTESEMTLTVNVLQKKHIVSRIQNYL